MKKTKRFLSMLLTLILCVGELSSTGFNVFAADSVEAAEAVSEDETEPVSDPEGEAGSEDEAVSEDAAEPVSEEEAETGAEAEIPAAEDDADEDADAPETDIPEDVVQWAEEALEADVDVPEDEFYDDDDDREPYRELTAEEIEADKATGYTGVRTADELYELLSRDGDAYISLYNDIDGMIGDSSLTGGCEYREYWCKLGKGTKSLNLNGFTFSISYHLNYHPGDSDERRSKYAENGSTLLYVGEGTTFILRDANGGGELHYDGLLKDSEKYWKDVRNILEVNGGTFIMNGGCLNGGRSKKYNAGGSRRQIHANGLIVGPGSNVTINAGTICGRGYYFNNEGHQRCGAINIKKNSADKGVFKKCGADASTSIIINDGEFIGYAQAHVIAGIDESNETCFKAIGGGYFYTTHLEFDMVNSDGYTITEEAGDANVPLRKLDLNRFKVWVKGTGSITSAVADTMKFSNNDTEIAPYEKQSSGMSLYLDRTGKTVDIDAATGHSGEWIRYEDAKARLDYTPLWSEESVVGDGAPRHTFVCYWSLWDSTGEYKLYPENDGILKNELEIPLSELFVGDRYRYNPGRTYLIRCDIREDYEGNHTYRPSCSAEGRVTLRDLRQYVNPDFGVSEQNNGDFIVVPREGLFDDLDKLAEENLKYEITLGNYYNEYAYEYISQNGKKFLIPAEEIQKNHVGKMRFRMEVKLYTVKADGSRQYLAKDGDICWNNEYYYLPDIKCNSAVDGMLTVYGNQKAVISSGITGQPNGSVVWLNLDNDKEVKYTDTLELTAEDGGGVWCTAVFEKDEMMRRSLNTVKVIFDPPKIESSYFKYNNNENSTITSRTKFTDSSFCLMAEVKASGVTISDPQFKWSLISSPDGKVNTSAKTYRVKANKKSGGYYNCEIPLSRMFESPQVLVDGDYVFSYSFYDGDKLLYSKERTIPFKVIPDKYIVKGYRDGENLVDVSGSYIYSADGMPVDIVAGPDPSIFVNEDMYIDARLFKSDKMSFSRYKSDGKTYGGSITLDAVDDYGVKNVSYKYKNSSVSTNTVEFNILYPLNEYVIESVDAPVVGKKLSDTKVTVPAGAKYTATVKWLAGDREETGETFQANVQYTAVVKIIPDAGMVMPVRFEGDATYLDNEQVSVKAKYDGDTAYRYLTASNARDGFIYDNSEFTTKASDLPVSTGTDRSAYQITYKTYDTLKGADFTYIDALNIQMSTELEGKGVDAAVINFDPAAGIDESAMKKSFKTADGKDFTVFEKGKTYTCTLTDISTKGTYRFDDNVKVYVNGLPLQVSDYSLKSGVNFWMTSVSFSFRIGKTAAVVDALTINVTEPIVGEDINNAKGVLVSSDPDDSPEWTAVYYIDANGNGKFDAGEEDFSTDGGKFVSGKIYCVHVSTYGNDDYVLGSGFTITCNGNTKDAEMTGDTAFADFILPEAVGVAYTVSFDLNGKPGTAPAAQRIAEGKTAAVPEEPKAEGFVFKVWCKDKAGKKAYDFSTPVKADITLYAKWEKSEELPMPEPLLGGKSALDPVPELIPGVTTDLYLVKGQKFNIGQGWYIDKTDKASKKKVSISKKGVFKAKAEGDAVIKCGSGALAWEVRLHISKPKMEKKSLKLELTEDTEIKSEKIALNYDAENLNIFWYSANPDVVIVDEATGKVTTVGKGSSKVTAYINGSAYNCTVTVKEKAPLLERTLHIAKGASKSISIKGLKKPVWVDSVKDIVTVKNNKVTAVNAGTTELTFTQDGREYKVTVIVDDPAMSGIGLTVKGKPGSNKYIIDGVKAGTETDLMFALTDRKVVFKSSKPDIAFIDENLNVEFRSKGKAKFTAKVNGKTVTINVNVTE